MQKRSNRSFGLYSAGEGDYRPDSYSKEALTKIKEKKSVTKF